MDGCTLRPRTYRFLNVFSFFSINTLLAVGRVNYRAAVPPPAELCATECQVLNRLIELLNQHIERLQSRFESLSCLDGDDAISEG